MAPQLPRILFNDKSFQVAAGMNSHEASQTYKPKWHFTREEIEEHSPSRKDGISHEQESHLRQMCCSYLQNLGIELKVPQVTIATATILCHRFYMHQSHAKNHWQAVANASMFLACKVDDTPRWLRDLVVAAYKLMYRWDPSAPQRIRQKEVYDKQKNLILMGETLILATVAFDLNIQLPYKPLVAALNSMEISQKEVAKVAWNFVNDWLRTTLCLQYKPHYIAAGSIFLAAKLQKIKLPSSNGKAWWMQFDVSPKQLEEVIQQMLQLLGQSRKQARPLTRDTETKIELICRKRKSESSESCISNESTVQRMPQLLGQSRKQARPFTSDTETKIEPICRKSESSESCISNESTVQDSRNSRKATVLSTSAVVKSSRKQQDVDANDTVNRNEDCRMNDSGCTNSVVEDGDGEVITEDLYQKSGCNIVSVKGSCPKFDVAGLRERLKLRKSNKTETERSRNDDDEEINSQAWIERELENGIESVFTL
ncbi:cyclin-T1-3-like isoform X1 [Primulina eburnea]|uniref:cyclin-T1-3-like isoform X1 n=2 Tax=Primulina eburnea TaxID=1245227 RepID=UPI003C6C4127